MYKVGLREYMTDLWNYIDMCYIWASIAQVILHTYRDPLNLECKITMNIVLFLGMGKTFFFLRIFDELSPIVTMLSRVMRDLRVFMLFFFILIIMFSLQLGVMGLANLRIKGDFSDKFKEAYFANDSYPGEEFKSLGLTLGNIFFVFRAAMGDFTLINSSMFLSDAENYIFWFMFFAILVLTNIIFLNFVIAEAGNSYSIVSEQLDQFILKEKSIMIDEAETMFPKRFRQPSLYPKYIVIRRTDS